MSRITADTSHTEHIDMPRHDGIDISPVNARARFSPPRSADRGIVSSGPVIGGDRRHFVKTILDIGEPDLSAALAYIFHTVVSQAVSSYGTDEIRRLYQKDLFYGRKSAAVAIAPPDETDRDETMSITETDDGEVLVGGSRIPGDLETPDLVLIVIPLPCDGFESARLVLLEANAPGVSFRLSAGRSYGDSGGRTVIADAVGLTPSMTLGRMPGGPDFSDRILFGWGAFGSAAMLTLMAAQAIRLVSWSYREHPGDWISSHGGGYTFGDVILDQEASLSYLTHAAESADAYPESSQLHGYKALRYAYRTTSRIVERATTLLEISNPHLATYLNGKRMEMNRLIGWQADAVPSCIRSYLPPPADRLLNAREYSSGVRGEAPYTEQKRGKIHVLERR